MIRAIIVDDEQGAREVLKDLVENFCPGIGLVGMAKDSFEADELINEQKPDLVFLDVEMPVRSGLQFLEDRGSAEFDVIFTSAFDKYAVQAIKLSALDYLIKPVQIKELVNAVHKVTEEKNGWKKIQNLLKNRQEKAPKIALSDSEGVEFVDVGDIIYAEAQGSYTKFTINNDKHITVSKPLREYEELLADYDFFRCHKSYLINLEQVLRYKKKRAHRNAQWGYRSGSKIQKRRTGKINFFPMKLTLSLSSNYHKNNPIK